MRKNNNINKNSKNNKNNKENTEENTEENKEENKENIILNKFIATIILHALGDTISFKNNEWYTKYGRNIVEFNIVNELLYEFIQLGGINRINLEGWHISVNTYMHMATAIVLYENKEKDVSEKFIENMKKIYLGVLSQTNEDIKNGINRGMDVHTYNVLNKYSKGEEYVCECEKISLYDRNNSSATRMLCIGLLYFGKEKRKELINNCIKIGKIVNCSPIGYLGGLTSALFTAFAMEKYNIEDWGHKLLELLQGEEITVYYKNDLVMQNEYDIYVMFWKKYMELKFDKNGMVNIKSNANLIFRNKFYNDNFLWNDEGENVIGYSGVSSVIIAYDCLLDARNNWEKLLIYSAFQIGDSNAVCSIASGWYGACYIWGDIPNNNLNYLEYKKEIYDIAKKLYKKHKSLH